jgi:hypothetical protein
VMFDCNYTVQESIISRTNQDGTVIIMKMDEGNTFFKINGVAAEVWKELSGKKEINQIMSELINSYNASEEQIENDVKEFVKTLLTKDLIKQV